MLPLVLLTVELSIVEVILGVAFTVAFEPPILTPVDAVTPFAKASAVMMLAWDCKPMSPAALTVELAICVSTVGLIVTLATEPEAAALIKPILTDVTSTVAFAVLADIALIFSPPAKSRLLLSIDDLVTPCTVAWAFAPPPESATPKPPDTDTAAAREVEIMLALSMDCKATLPPVVFTVEPLT